MALVQESSKVCSNSEQTEERSAVYVDMRVTDKRMIDSVIAFEGVVGSQVEVREADNEPPSLTTLRILSW